MTKSFSRFSDKNRFGNLSLPSASASFNHPPVLPPHTPGITFRSAHLVQIGTGISSGTVAFSSISTHGKAHAPSFHPMSASSTWNISEAEFPATGSPREKLVFALKYAARAPTESGWQPGHFRMENKYLELVAKHKPELDAVDPDGRELMIGCGAALQYLKLALKHFGCLGRLALFCRLCKPPLADT